MPEGHSVARWAIGLRALIGEPLLEVGATKRYAERAEALVGQHITAVEAHGKHLFTHLSGGWTVHTHAMQYGSWQIGEPGQTLRKERRYVRLRFLTAEHEAVFFHGPVVEILTPEEFAAHDKVHLLGPDILAPTFDRAEAVRRLRLIPERPIGDAILDQRNVAGIGNIYKSEGLFGARIDPRRPVGEVTDAELDRLWDAVIPMMQDGVTRYGATITTTPEVQAEGYRNWVYQRSKRPCLRCATTVQFVRQGDLGRMTFFCPTCQT